MPKTKKEEVYFGLMMCSGMVVFMTLYNLFTHGLIGKLSLGEVLIQLLAAFIVAFLVELFIVGPAAKKIAFSLPYDKSKKVTVILVLAFCMVSGMVLCMSLYGLLNSYFSGAPIGESWLESYVTLVGQNFIFALPLQLVVVGPLARYVFAKLQYVQGS
ncbi:hypothetical protein N0M98_21630 [Paenibacillus doosanensis]|uniref:DUF2798 domain-containing protein n=1 Tax=Paenibacillus konkukensis TaxID=2020716 RepID=A0ABY4RL28_9BACL|nr:MULTISPECIES: hypothetical protein [Paenibacillus]MCS7462728.1 hypothetical protein [Paenibacillus doosanensis]UQZ82354.1 hypothetical protein SK3146_01511 [Paenibacillus konkukensis]